jgi:hypothetical protein
VDRRANAFNLGAFTVGFFHLAIETALEPFSGFAVPR